MHAYNGVLTFLRAKAATAFSAS